MDKAKYIVSNYLNLIKKDILITNNDEDIFEELNKFLTSGSKYIRSTLAILYLKSHNIEVTKDIIKILSAGELIHNASLLHDDVIDNSKVRRGNITIGEKFSSKISILMGDFLVSIAIKKLLDFGNLTIINNFRNCTEEMSRAELLQYSLRGQIPSETDYINICRGKTASLFIAILQSVATISKLNVSSAIKFAENFGILFQIKNDIEPKSSQIDKQNAIFTAYDIFGVEKTKILIDNYRANIDNLMQEFCENCYCFELKNIIERL